MANELYLGQIVDILSGGAAIQNLIVVSGTTAGIASVTSSWASRAVLADLASTATTATTADTASFVQTARTAVTASFVQTAQTALLATTASNLHLLSNGDAAGSASFTGVINTTATPNLYIHFGLIVSASA